MYLRLSTWFAKEIAHSGARTPLLPVWRECSVHANHTSSVERDGAGEMELSEETRLAQEKRAREKFEYLCQKTVDNVRRCGFGKARDLNKIFNKCVSAEQLEKAEDVLRVFRHGVNNPLPSLPLAVANACIRVGKAEVVMHIVRDEMQYGLLPSKEVYHVTMKALIEKRKSKNALSAFNHMTASNVLPDGMSYLLATKASFMYTHKVFKTTKKQTDGGEMERLELDLERPLELCGRCLHLDQELGKEGYQFILHSLLKEGMDDRVTDTLSRLERNESFPRQLLFELHFDVLMYKGELSATVSMLSELCNHDNKRWHGVVPPQSGLLWLQEAIEQSQDTQLKDSFQELKSKIESTRQGVRDHQSNDSQS